MFSLLNWPSLNRYVTSHAPAKYIFPIFLFLLALLPANVSAGDALLDTATRFAHGGAPQLALARVERDQPARQADAPRWFQWEVLRLSLLVELNRDQEVLQRASRLPPEIPEESHALYLFAAQAALRLKEPVLTREYLAKWLWLGELSDAQKKDARRMVIQSYIAQHKPDTAYLAMLRFQQDYAPLPAADVAQFVEQLLLAGGLTEAGGWLAQLDEASPLKLLLRLKTGWITPEAAVAAAKAALEPIQPPQPAPQPSPSSPPPPPPSKSKTKKPPVPPPSVVKKALKVAPALKLSEKDTVAYWSIIALAAGMLKDPALQAEALERQLNLSASQEDGLFGVDVENLLQAYAELASKVANQAQLLAGDDAAWFELATHTSSPLEARALYASLLSPQNASLELRISAETNLTKLLLDNKLEVVAMRLFASNAHFPAANHAVLAVLGEIALRSHHSYPQAYQSAAKYLRGVDAPQTDVPPIEWQLKRARAFVLGGAPDEAAVTVKRIFSEGLQIDQKATTEILRIAYELDGRQHNGAEMILLQLAAFADSRHWGEIYLTLGRITEGRKDFAKAAEYYLQAAEWTEGTKARQSAADCMVRAGLKEDAKRQYTLLLKTVKTPVERETLKQALSRL